MQVRIVKYNPAWPKEFEQEAASIKATLDEVLTNIFHIGSTSVPGLVAKPIIDIMLEVTDLLALDAKSQDMEQLNYEVMGEYGIPGRRYFRKGGDHRTHHVHAFLTGDPNLKRHLAFRDYLRAHPDIALAYGALKLEIANKGNGDTAHYSESKDPFIKLHQRKALKWYENEVSGPQN
ncbi:MAG: GrpB family protein [Bacteroidota bacterium]